ncbi:4'-phosphopantetheinyl transferase family protein [Capnocytophaga catalasegens]|uniref:4'-phosphopantetheinyl transferase n=1 Tax=Capnocytophaga catalasegens TaxID=1004260 RepID=A0AAV5AXB1_9FLAO|nr:4'-phosphopantetheinyl transferase superfamily protein [Capnocytophaga catalasegens]GIZ15123.1 4'-phosphopantetheinyl transferase [Capnocytophaga catalasegens]GJM49638.1 4'-phosphopantetheinyl transferase [Capnocytophaga catalasegens]GJM52703.1 4'-phosphopantetheinyl transferase [Capnocytophaga catalasegens]
MPFFEKINLTDASIFIWKITETETELFSGISLSNIDNERLTKMKSERHRKSLLAVRHLIQLAEIPQKALYYNENGKPFLSNGQYISISHSHQFAIIGLSYQKIGIDIEKKQTRIERLAYRFTQWKSGKNNLQSEKISILTKIWAAKEALYKAADVPSVDFKEHLILDKNSIQANEFSARITHPQCQEKYKVFCGEIEDFVWSLVLLNN